MARIAISRPAGRTGGNRITAERWAALLESEGHQVIVEEGWSGRPCDLLIALHARRSLPDIRRLRTESPSTPLIVAGTGSDLYVDLPGGGEPAAQALAGLEAADCVVVLQREALAALPPALRPRGRVIQQSVHVPTLCRAPDPARFLVVILAKLLPIKDTLTAAAAARLLPHASRTHILHLGGSLDAGYEARVRTECDANPRYEWVGERPHAEALEALASAHLSLCTSLAEGGANAVGEALALGVPLLASDISGNRGLMGKDHPGLFTVGDPEALATLLARAESSPEFLDRLTAAGALVAPRLSPECERERWALLVNDLLARQGGSET